MGGGGGGLREREGGEGERHWEAVGISGGAGRGLKGIGVGLATAGAGAGSAAAGERGKKEELWAADYGIGGWQQRRRFGGSSRRAGRDARLRLVRGGEREARLGWDSG